MKTALVYAEDELTLKESMSNFLLDKNYLDYKILALLSDNATDNFSVPDLNAVKKLRQNFPATLDVITPQAVNKFVYKFVDAVFILFAKNFSATIDTFDNFGIPPRKIILWSANNSPGIIQFVDADGTKVVCFEGLEFHVKNQSDADFVSPIIKRLEDQKHLYNMLREQYVPFLKHMYRQLMGRELDLDNPKTYTEKINWLKLYDSTPLKGRLSDKYSVRDYVADKIGADKLKPLLGAWDSFDEIDFDALPNKFALKCNHGSGMNIIVKDKNSLDMRQAREKINAWLATDYGMSYLELNYSLVKRKVIAEQYISEVETGLYDYKVHCFNGEPKIIQVLQTQNQGFGNRAAHQAFYDTTWENLGAMFEDAPLFPNPIPKPSRLEEMLRYAKILCAPFSYARADFYEIRGEIFFAEITFYSDAGFLPYRRTWTYERDLEIGNMIKL
ncbi:MAG: hypothetical protein SR3Q1_08815 [Quinella sp. 3Q1]|nr:hypothetical protein [Quinella sp. 3Q1]